MVNPKQPINNIVFVNSMQTYTIADTTAPLSLFAKDGYYTVGNKIFNHKIYALQEATRTGLPVKWHFNEEVFGQLNWRQDPGLSILDLYRMRAQQLRDRYKYVICCWSGGGDSTTMVEAFLENNIHLDEIVTLWPLTISQGKYNPNARDTSATNMLSEWDFSIRPRIELWQKQYPNQRITVADTCKLPTNEYLDDTVTIMEKHSYLAIQRWRQMDQILRERIDQYGDSVCIVIGSNPVDISILDNNYVAVNFNDEAAGNGIKSDHTATGMTRNVEAFYWTPDLPEIVLQQAHLAFKILQADPASRTCVTHMGMQPDRTFAPVYKPDQETYRKFIKKIVYPKFPRNWFQVVKQFRTHENPEWETWFWTNPHAQEFLMPYQSAIRSHVNLVADQYKIIDQGFMARFKKFTSRWYMIGQL